MNKYLRFLLLISFLGISNYAFAWGRTGHRVIVKIADNHLSKKTKKEIKKIVGDQPLEYWAGWSDFIKSDSVWNRQTSSWHYLNFPGGLDKSQFNEFLKESSEQNIYKRIQILTEELKNRKNLTQEEKQHKLYFLIHLIGDIHQPLHIGREEDLGGNKFQVKWFNQTTNLHSVWDTKIIDFQKYSYTEYAEMLDFHDKKYNEKLSAGGLDDWMFDCYTQTNFIYAHTIPGENLRWDYEYLHHDLLENQLLKGGLRLAKVLNEIFR